MRTIALILTAAAVTGLVGNRRLPAAESGKVTWDAPDTRSRLIEHVRAFNAVDDELYTNAIPNDAAEAFLLANAPRFACPDETIERTYYFRWWTFRKHLRRDLGFWTVSEFLPKVGWSGKGNTIVCAAGHHLREGRWLRDDAIMADDARFWLTDPEATHRWKYSSWLFTGTRLLAAVTGRDDLPRDLLDAAVSYYRRWEQGFVRGRAPMGGDGKGGFLSIDNYEGTEISLGGNGYKPLMSSAMWSEAKSIAAVARAVGRGELADEFEAKAETNRLSLVAHCWNADVGLFTTATAAGEKGTVRELHGYAPWYFGVPTGHAAEWVQLTDPHGFAGRFGLTFPERRAPGFVLSYEGHECKWNGPSWPFATSIALTAYLNDLHAGSPRQNAFAALLRQYAASHCRRRDPATEGDARIVPWIDENLNPDTGDWIARTVILRTESMRKRFARERGKDYNHSTFCDLVISGLVGLVPNGDEGFTVDPLAPSGWEYLALENVRYRGHDVDILWRRGTGMAVRVDGRVVARRPTLGCLAVPCACPREKRER